MLSWIEANDVVLGWLFGLSLVMFLGALVAVPVIVVRLPADYFCGRRRKRMADSIKHPVLRMTWRVAKTVIGLVLVWAGIAMLVLPGQGILTILIGVSLTEFPGKYRLERWIIHQGPLLRVINALRRRYGRPPLEFGETK